MVGEVLSKESLMVTEYIQNCDSAKTPDVFECHFNSQNRMPMIRSKRSGKWYTVGWSDLITLAEGIGISK